jgi:hypothetical protein
MFRTNDLSFMIPLRSMGLIAWTMVFVPANIATRRACLFDRKPLKLVVSRGANLKKIARVRGNDIGGNCEGPSFKGDLIFEENARKELTNVDRLAGLQKPVRDSTVGKEPYPESEDPEDTGSLASSFSAYSVTADVPIRSGLKLKDDEFVPGNSK